MYLQKHPKKKKNDIYNYYSIAESYREDGKSKKRVITYLGKLAPEKAQQIRNVLKIRMSTDTIVTTLDDLLFVDHWHYLDVAFLNHLWDEEWGFSELFPLPQDSSENRKKDISTGDIAKILTFYRCLNPGSYLNAVDWFKTTACDLIIGVDRAHFNESRIYRELTVIEQQKEKIEHWLYETLKERDNASMRMVFYDLSDSHFEGTKCEIASTGRTKSHGFKSKRVVLSLLVNLKGEPFSWDILEDYTADVKTLTGNADKWAQKFGFKKITLVFDRGMVSDDNLIHLENSKKYLYITAMNKNQLPTVEGIETKRFKNFTENTIEKKILSIGLTKYDDKTYYEDLGVDNDKRRHVLVFSPYLLKTHRKARDILIEKAIEEIEQEKQSLLKAQKSRHVKPTEKKIDKILNKFNVSQFLSYNLKSTVLTKNNGSKIQTFNLIYEKNTEATKKAMLTDGIWMLVTNISETTEPKEYRLDPRELIKAYRDKNRVEEGFKEVKSFLKFQPTFVYTNKHVRTHYTICILSYLLDVTITNKLRENKIEEVSSVNKVYHILKRCVIGKIGLKGDKSRILKLTTMTNMQKNILEMFNCKHLGMNNHLKSIRVKKM
ncbi:MAG: IS1634 family transposase [Methanosarcinales archaeon]|nr:MAG: IS1634 family transposase [Methanosarcinales archaeon]